MVTIVTSQGEVSQCRESQLVLQSFFLTIGFDHLLRWRGGRGVRRVKLAMNSHHLVSRVVGWSIVVRLTCQANECMVRVGISGERERRGGGRGVTRVIATPKYRSHTDTHRHTRGLNFCPCKRESPLSAPGTRARASSAPTQKSER